MIDILGWIAGLLFAVCALPQAITCIRQGHAKGLSPIFIWTWFIGEILMMVYVSIKMMDGPLLFNYTLNLIFVGIILKYIYFPRR